MRLYTLCQCSLCRQPPKVLTSFRSQGRNYRQPTTDESPSSKSMTILPPPRVHFKQPTPKIFGVIWQITILSIVNIGVSSAQTLHGMHPGPLPPERNGLGTLGCWNSACDFTHKLLNQNCRTNFGQILFIFVSSRPGGTGCLPRTRSQYKF